VVSTTPADVTVTGDTSGVPAGLELGIDTTVTLILRRVDEALTPPRVTG
jgi:hypothetical protein